MGYGSYEDRYGRPAGYNVVAHCDARGCMKRIDRGQAYKCGAGSADTSGFTCERFFCTDHRNQCTDHALCHTCAAKAPLCDDCGVFVMEGRRSSGVCLCDICAMERGEENEE